MFTNAKHRAVTGALGLTLCAATALGGTATAQAATLASSPAVSPQPVESAPAFTLPSDIGTGAIQLSSFAPTKPAAAQKNDWAKQTARFAGCLAGFGFVAAPIVAGFMTGGAAGAKLAAKAWIPRLGPVGQATVKWCMQSVLGVKM